MKNLVFRRRWLWQTTSEELFIHEDKLTTNNGAECYHSKLKSIIKISHPRIWTLMTTLNDKITDTIILGEDTSRPRKKKNVLQSLNKSICTDTNSHPYFFAFICLA